MTLGMNNYSLNAYYNSTASMVYDTPKPLIDWPRSSIIDTTGQVAGNCDHLCVQMNAYAVVAQDWMSVLAPGLKFPFKACYTGGCTAFVC